MPLVAVVDKNNDTNHNSPATFSTATVVGIQNNDIIIDIKVQNL